MTHTDIPLGPVLDTSTAPHDARAWSSRSKPDLLLTQEHHMCPGCGEPLAVRQFLETIEELGLGRARDRASPASAATRRSRGTMDVDLVQALHGRAPSVATGVKRMLPDALVFTLQGDGDMVNEGLQEVLHTAARGENVTCILLNNGVFGETGGHMTATSVIGQRTKNSLDGRDAEYHGYPILIGDLIAQLQGAAYVARGSVHNAGAVARTKKMFKRAFETQLARRGLLVRRGAHDVPDRLVHPDRRRARLHERDPRRGPHHGRAQGRRPGPHDRGAARRERRASSARSTHALARGGLDD